MSEGTNAKIIRDDSSTLRPVKDRKQLKNGHVT